jgi:hypothetical protein
MMRVLRSLRLLAPLAVLPSLRAGWTELAPGLAGDAVVRALGVPLVQSHGGGGRWAVWTYDAGGCVLLEHGRVTHWTPSRGNLTTHTSPGPRYVAAGGVRPLAAGAATTRARTTTRW